ncbi:FAD/NAD(P)-binding protein [Kocuria varians]|uniref:FAD/NAD(P)-binding protein n=2 Tax=Kocuria varians TaxID=1272 RepID=UPI001E4D7D59|nr:FAD/NAD(P)-binding protein [Kocuria varians]
MSKMNIAIIGRGTVGACMLVALAEHVNDYPKDSILTLIDEPQNEWRGRAYQDDTQAVLANGPLTGMSLKHHDAEHGYRWAKATGIIESEELPGPIYLSRPKYGEYIDFAAREAIDVLRMHGWQVKFINEFVSGIEIFDDMPKVYIGDESIDASHVILCAGGRTESDIFGLKHSSWFIENPYPLKDQLAGVPTSSTVGVIGTGMTATDIFLALKAQDHTGRIILASRSGILPAVRSSQAPSAATPVAEVEKVASALNSHKPMRALREYLHDLAGSEFVDSLSNIDRLFSSSEPGPRLLHELEGGLSSDPVILALRKMVVQNGQDVWVRLRADRKVAILRSLHTALWSFASPIPEQSGRSLSSGLREGQLEVVSQLESAKLTPGGFSLNHKGGQLEVDVLVNAVTSPQRDMPLELRGLVANLVETGVAQLSPAGGLEVDPRDSRVLSSSGFPQERLYALGELTRGTFYLTSAISAFTRRAEDIARSLAYNEPSL